MEKNKAVPVLSLQLFLQKGQVFFLHIVLEIVVKADKKTLAEGKRETVISVEPFKSGVVSFGASFMITGYAEKWD